MFILRKADWSQYASKPILPDDSEYESTGDAWFEDDSTGDDRSRYDDGPSNSKPLGGGSHREDQSVDDDDDGAESVHTVAEDDQQESSTEEISVLDDRQDVKPAAQKKRRRLQPPMVCPKSSAAPFPIAISFILRFLGSMGKIRLAVRAWLMQALFATNGRGVISHTLGRKRWMMSRIMSVQVTSSAGRGELF